jgi:hypothetical protein
MPTLVCNACQQEFHLQTSGVVVIEFNYQGPYRIWAADEFICYGCGATVLGRFAEVPSKCAYEDGFQSYYTQVRDLPITRLCFESTAQRLAYEEQRAKEMYKVLNA